MIRDRGTGSTSACNGYGCYPPHMRSGLIIPSDTRTAGFQAQLGASLGHENLLDRVVSTECSYAGLKGVLPSPMHKVLHLGSTTRASGTSTGIGSRIWQQGCGVEYLARLLVASTSNQSPALSASRVSWPRATCYQQPATCHQQVGAAHLRCIRLPTSALPLCAQRLGSHVLAANGHPAIPQSLMVASLASPVRYCSTLI
jgi:hypothetical protein